MLSRKINKLIKVDSLKKYLKYGLGEIILLVLGILIALQINNWNENRKTNNELKVIFNTVKSDLELDIAEAEMLIKNYEMRINILDSVFNQVQDDSFKYKQKLSIGVNTSYDVLIINKRGVNLLKNFKAQNSIISDSLILSISDFYGNSDKNNDLVADLLNSSVEETIKHYRDNFWWYEKLINGLSTPEMVDNIFSDMVTRNHIIHYKMIAERNYVPMLKLFIEDGNKLIDKLEKL